MSFYEKSYLEAAKSMALLINDLLIVNIHSRFPSLRHLTALSHVLAIMVGIALLGSFLLLGPTASIVPPDGRFAAATLIDPSSTSSEEEPMTLDEATLAYASVALDEKHQARALRKVKNMGIQSWVDEVNSPRRGKRRYLVEGEEAERWLWQNSLAARI